MSAVMMLEYLGVHDSDRECTTAAARITRAYEAALDEGQKTRDLGGDLSTEGFKQAIIDRIQH